MIFFKIKIKKYYENKKIENSSLKTKKIEKRQKNAKKVEKNDKFRYFMKQKYKHVFE